MATHTILFTGHLIDAPDRKQPRFPPEAEELVRAKIKTTLMQQKEKYSAVQGIAGAACGGDILFQESCLELGIPSIIYLPLPVCDYQKTSVSFAGQAWEDRFDRLLHSLPVFLLPQVQNREINIWEAANNRMLREALINGSDNMTLIALWNGQGGDGPGGTQHLVAVVKASSAEVVIISI